MNTTDINHTSPESLDVEGLHMLAVEESAKATIKDLEEHMKLFPRTICGWVKIKVGDVPHMRQILNAARKKWPNFPIILDTQSDGAYYIKVGKI